MSLSKHKQVGQHFVGLVEENKTTGQIKAMLNQSWNLLASNQILGNLQAGAQYHSASHATFIINIRKSATNSAIVGFAEIMIKNGAEQVSALTLHCLPDEGDLLKEFENFAGQKAETTTAIKADAFYNDFTPRTVATPPRMRPQAQFVGPHAAADDDEDDNYEGADNISTGKSQPWPAYTYRGLQFLAFSAAIVAAAATFALFSLAFEAITVEGFDFKDLNPFDQFFGTDMSSGNHDLEERVSAGAGSVLALLATAAFGYGTVKAGDAAKIASGGYTPVNNLKND